MASTKNLHLSMTPEGTNKSFLDWRLEQDGTENSNMQKLDAAWGDMAARVDGALAAVGKPTVAETAADMTDQTRAYVYTGSETGYTYGNWYYYDAEEEEWVSGGVYQASAVETDETLRVEGMAADAKATGELVAINETPMAGTKISITTTTEDVTLATMDDVDELKTQLSGLGVFNVCTYTGVYSYANADARAAVPSEFKKIGQIIAYKNTDGKWKIEQYINDTITDSLWLVDSSWRVIYISSESAWVTGTSYTNNTVNSAVVYNTNTATFASKKVKVSEGDVVYVRAYNGTGYKAWATTDANGIVKRNCQLNTGNIREEIITIASGEEWLYCNTSATSIDVSMVTPINLSDFTLDLAERLFAETEVYNVNDRVTDTTYTIETGRNAVPKEVRKKGLIITYKLANGIWRTEEYIGENPTSTTTWTAHVNWSPVHKKYDRNTIVVAPYNATAFQLAFADYVAADQSNGIYTINLAIGSLLNYNNSKGRVYLLNGTYEGTNIIAGQYPNIIIEGESTDGVIINSSNSGGDIDFQLTAGCTLKNLTLTNSIANSRMYNLKKMENVKMNGVIVDSTNPAYNKYIINVGDNYAVSDLTRLFLMFDNNVFEPDSENRFEVHIYGHIKHKGSLAFKYDYVDYIGHNAIVELQGNENINILIQDGTNSDDVVNHITNIHFLKVGCYNYYSNGAVMLSAKNYIFKDCIFENKTCSPSPFIQTQYDGDNVKGARRHGIVIDIHAYGKDCKTEFHNCVGIGSPYGFQNTRGWYFVWGSPKVYDSVGYGGGIGWYGHGIICHRSSNPEFFNCRAYGGNRSYRDASGFRYQCVGSGTFIGCVGYASTGERYRSNGVPYETLHEKCVELGITDESFFYDGENVNYDGLTLVVPDDGNNTVRFNLLSALTEEDVEFEALGELTSGGSGFSFWANAGKAKLINCIGYAGAGENTCGLKAERKANPTVIGGYFGYNLHAWDCNYERDSGQTYQTITIDPENLSEYAPYDIISVNLTVPVFTSTTKLFVETIESTPQRIVNGIDLSGISSIAIIDSSMTHVAAGVKLKAWVTDGNNSPITINGDMIFHFLWTEGNTMYGVQTVDSSSLDMNGCEITASTQGTGIDIETDSTSYSINHVLCKTLGSTAIDADVSNLRIFDSAFEGTVDAEITFATKTAINSSSNYSLS